MKLVKPLLTYKLFSKFKQNGKLRGEAHTDTQIMYCKTELAMVKLES